MSQYVCSYYSWILVNGCIFRTNGGKKIARIYPGVAWATKCDKMTKIAQICRFALTGLRGLLVLRRGAVRLWERYNGMHGHGRILAWHDAQPCDVLDDACAAGRGRDRRQRELVLTGAGVGDSWGDNRGRWERPHHPRKHGHPRTGCGDINEIHREIKSEQR